MLDQSAPRSMPPLADTSHHDGLPGGLGDLLILIGRVLVGQLFVISGWGKLFALSAFAASLAKRGVPAGIADPLSYVGAAVEFFGGFALVLGLKTRWAAALMALFTVVASFIGHRYWEFTDAALRGAQQVNFYKNVTITGGILFLIVCGGGRFSLDGMFGRGSR